MKTSLLLCAVGSLAMFLFTSCADPNYYNGGTTYHSSSSFTTLPSGYRTVHVSGVPYYYHGNDWYRRSSGRYIRCARPYGYYGPVGRVSCYPGYGISSLSYGYRSCVVGGNRYYHHGNTWYRRNGSRYVVCPRPRGYNGPYMNYTRRRDCRQTCRP